MYLSEGSGAHFSDCLWRRLDRKNASVDMPSNNDRDAAVIAVAVVVGDPTNEDEKALIDSIAHDIAPATLEALQSKLSPMEKKRLKLWAMCTFASKERVQTWFNLANEAVAHNGSLPPIPQPAPLGPLASKHFF